ncbi:sigma-70 family RNA polymerase sigma factor [uncultured Clostridium sp.]|uniref:sigma-70 family RNA polymerase sigma factor n=1 Tax=uncultured Clostridium sp. TaxID=59620 RepID=UPI0028E4E592|nr:sigma-70 family RNA polymerase sigma factor [uncultured Clostridium sp.]
MGKEENIYISKDVYKKVEETLEGYYSDKIEMRNMKSEIEQLEKNIRETKENIATTNVNIDYHQSGIGISERVQTSSAGTSYAEKAIMDAIDKLEKELSYYIRRLNKLKGKVRRIRLQNNRIEQNIGMLTNELQLFLKYKYQDKLSIPQIAMKLNYSDATASRRRSELVLNVARFMHWI